MKMEESNIHNINIVSEEEVLKYQDIFKSFSDVSLMLDTPLKTVQRIFFESYAWERLKDRLRRFCFNHGISRECDDYIMEYSIKLMQERNLGQTLDQFCIDLSRKLKLTKRSGQKRELPQFVNIDDISKELKGLGCGHRGSVRPEEMICKKSRIYYTLIMDWGFTIGEISELFECGVSDVISCIKGSEKKKRKKDRSVEIVRELRRELTGLKKIIVRLECDLVNSKKKEMVIDVENVKYNQRTLAQIEADLFISLSRAMTQNELSETLGICLRTCRNKLRKYKLKCLTENNNAKKK